MEYKLDYRDIAGLREAVQAAGEKTREELRPYGVTSRVAKGLALALLQIRLQIIKDGVPDLKAVSMAAKTAGVDAFWYASEGREPNDRDATRERLRQSVRNQMSDVLRDYARSLDSNPDEYAARFALVKEKYPELTPSEAVLTFYGLAPLSKREVMVQRNRDAAGG